MLFGLVLARHVLDLYLKVCATWSYAHENAVFRATLAIAKIRGDLWFKQWKFSCGANVGTILYSEKFNRRQSVNNENKNQIKRYVIIASYTTKNKIQ